MCVLASKLYGCKSIGCELEASLVALFRKNVEREEQETARLIHIEEGDLRLLNMSNANRDTIITMYLLPDSIESLKPKLSEALALNAVLVCNTWGPKNWQPIEVRVCGPYNNVKLLKYDKSSIR